VSLITGLRLGRWAKVVSLTKANDCGMGWMGSDQFGIAPAVLLVGGFAWASAIMLAAVGNQADAPRANACAAAVDYSRSIVSHRFENHPWIFDAAPDDQSMRLSAHDLRASIWTLDRPSIELSMRFAKATTKGALDACPELRNLLTDRQIAFGSRAVDEMMAKSMASWHNGNGLYSSFIVSLSLPVLSPDGREALAYESSTAGPLGGGGHIIHLRRNRADRWVVVDELSRWIS